MGVLADDGPQSRPRPEPRNLRIRLDVQQRASEVSGAIRDATLPLEGGSLSWIIRDVGEGGAKLRSELQV